MIWLLACLSRPYGPDDSVCFVDGTRIDTPDGPRAIESLAPGDVVWSMDTSTRQRVQRRVVRRIEARSTRLARVQVGQCVIQGVTPQHPFYDPERDRWVRARDLAPGQPVALATGPATVDAVAWREEAATVHDLTLEGPEHNFFAEGVLVHNKSVGGDSDWTYIPPGPDSVDRFTVEARLALADGLPTWFLQGGDGPYPSTLRLAFQGPDGFSCAETFEIGDAVPVDRADLWGALTLDLEHLEGDCDNLDRFEWGNRDPREVLLEHEWTVGFGPPSAELAEAAQASVEQAELSWDEWEPAVAALHLNHVGELGLAWFHVLDEQNRLVPAGPYYQPQPHADVVPNRVYITGITRELDRGWLWDR